MAGKGRNMRGFTFIETILAIVVVGVIASVAAKVLLVGLDVYALIVNRNNAFQTGRYAMERIEDELLMLASADISLITDTRINFRDIDGAWTDFHRTTYTQGGRTIPCINRGSDFLAGDVTTMDFDYYRETGVATIFASQVRRINIELVVTAPGNAGTLHLRSDVFPRKFMYTGFQ